MADKTMREQVDFLINTSVQDLQSSLDGYGKDDIQLLRLAHRRVSRRGEKTKARVLATYIRKLTKPSVCSRGCDMSV